MNNTIIFIDSAVPDYLQLAANVSVNTEVVILYPQENGIEKITKVLENRQDVDSVQIISHGSQGQVFLGNTVLNNQNLSEYTYYLKKWGIAFSEFGDILLLGCNVASGEIGQEFIAQLSAITGADVAASEDITGKGDWDLEANTGVIDTPLGIQAETLTAYTGILGEVGQGLYGVYYYDDNFKEGVASRQIDDTVNFNWGRSETINGINVQGAFSVRWEGAVVTDGMGAGSYTFKLTSDDGARLWFIKNGAWVNVIDYWTEGGTTTKQGTITLDGDYQRFQLDYQDTGGDAKVKLEWQPPGASSFEVIPSWRLFPDTDSTTNAITTPVPTISISAVNSTYWETGGRVEFKITASNIPTFPDGSNGVVVYLSTSNGDDVIRMTTGETTRVYNYNINDNIYNPNHSFTASIQRGSYIRGTQSATVSIVDNEPNFILTAVSAATEGRNGPTFTLTNNNYFTSPTDRPITFYYQVQFNSDSNPKADYRDFTTTNSYITFSTGNYQQNFTPGIINNDVIYEGETPESFRIVPLSSSEYQATYYSQDYLIYENEPLISLSKIRDTQEGAVASLNEHGQFEINFNRPTPQDFDLYLALDLTANKAATPGTFVATTPGSDYTIYYYFFGETSRDKRPLLYDSSSYTPGNLRLPVPQGKQTIYVEIEPIDDDIYDPDETVNLVLKDSVYGTNWYYGIDPNNNRKTLTIRDNEPIVSLGNVVNPQEGFGYGSTLVGLGKALELKSGNAVSVGSKPSLNLAAKGQFTQEAWLFSNVTDNNDRRIIGSDTSPSIWLVNQTSIKVGFGSNTFTVQNAFNKNNWNHIATTFDGVDYKLYVNGLQVYSTNSFQGVTIPTGTSLQIGGTASNGFIGVVDEVHIWNVARTASQINRNLTTPLKGDEDGLVGYWQFNGNLNDTTTSQNNLSATGTVNYLENPATQIGYVDVTLNKEVTAPQGLWIQYNLGGTATKGQDYWGSEIRKVSTNPSTQFNGIFIPKGESSGRIYLAALPDGVAEDNETIQVTLTDYDFDRETRGGNFSNYQIDRSNNSRTLTIADNQAYQPGIIVLNEYNEVVNASNPLGVKDGSTTFKVKLASQPTQGFYLDIKTSNTLLRQTYFDTQNWNTPQSVTLNISPSYTQLNFNGISIYNVPTTVPLSFNPSDKVRVGEGNASDANTIVPDISVVNSGDIAENTEGYFAIRLNTPAPDGGLTINYSLSGTAQVNTDYTNPGQSIKVLAGDTEAIIPINPLEDNIVEGTETVKITIEKPTTTLKKQIESLNQDGISNRSNGVVDSSQQAIDDSNSNYVLMTQTDAAARYSSEPNGLPDNGFFLGNNYHPNIQLPYNNNDDGANVRILLNNGESFTIPLNGQKYNELHLAALATQGDSSLRLIFTYTDGTTLITDSQVVPDWFNEITETSNRYYLKDGMDRVRLDGAYENANDPALFGFRFLPDPSKGINQITVEKVGAGGRLVFFGFSNTSTELVTSTLNIIDSDVAGLQVANSQANQIFADTFTPLITEETSRTSAIQLDGTNYVKLPNSATLNLNNTQQFTLEAWIQPTSNDTLSRSVFGSTTNSTEYPSLWIEGTKLWFTTGTQNIFTNNVIRANQWNHIAYSFDGSTYRAYVNGIFVGSYSSTSVHSFNVQSLAIGNTAGGGNKFIGAIDDVRLWNVVRSENEIKNSSAIELKGNESGLIGNWRFNNDLLDNSVNQNNGTEVKTTNSLAYITGAVDSSSQSAFGIRLNSKPVANVTVAISGLDTTEGKLSQSSLSFTPSNWNQYQTITVSGVDDTEADGDVTYNLVATTNSTDTNYQNKSISVKITNLDNEKNVEGGTQPNSPDVSLPLATIRTLISTPLQEGNTTATSNFVFPVFSLSSGPGGVGSTNGQSNLKLWLTGDSVRNAGQWNDLSGYNNHATQSNTNNQPTKISNVLNGNSVVAFDGVSGANDNDYLRTNSVNLQGNAPRSFIAVVNNIQATNWYENILESGYFSGNNKPAYALGYRPYFYSTEQRLNNWYGDDSSLYTSLSLTSSPTILNSQYNGSLDQIFVNGTLAASQNVTLNTGYSSISIGSASYPLKGQIAEIMVFDKALTTVERTLVNNYLSAKYALTISDDKYNGDDPTKGNYDFDVAGIGKESDGSNTNGANYGLAIKNGDFLKDNGDYIVIGSQQDRYTANTLVNTDLPTGLTNRWSKLWYLDKTDINNNNGTIDITFNSGNSGLNQPMSGNYSLLYRGATSGNFAVVAGVIATNTGSEVTFQGVNTSLINDGYYTLGIQPTVPQIEINLDKPAGSNGLLVTVDLGKGTAIYNKDFSSTQTLFLSQTGQVNPFNNIDIGTNSYPAFTDIDKDGDLDLFIGTNEGTIKFYKNQGSQINPLYIEQTGNNNPLNAIYSSQNYADKLSRITFVDIDSDGDADAFINAFDNGGLYRIFYYKNTGTANNPSFVLGNDLLPRTDSAGVPAFGDLDGDNDLDVIIGNNLGAYYKNTGTASNPQFTLQTYLNVYGVGKFYGSNLVDLDFDGDLDLVSRDSNGNVVTNFNIGGTSNPQFSEVQGSLNPFNGINLGSNATPVLVDIDGDSDLDIVSGGADGTLKYYQQVQGVQIAPGQTKATVTLQSLPDNIDEDDETIKVALNPGTGYRVGTTDNNITLTIKDDIDTAGITITPGGTGTTTAESGASLGYSVKLNTQPVQNVKLTIGSNDPSEAQLKVNGNLSNIIALQFTPDNWNKPQTFEVVGQDDFVDDDDIAYKIVTKVSSQDAKYNGLGVAPLSLTNIDNDDFGVVITEPSQTSEGKLNIYGVNLKSQPTGEVRVVLTPSDGQIQLNKESIGKPLTLTFNPRNWNQSQLVQVLAVDDDIVEFFHTSQIKVQTESGKVLYGELDDTANNAATGSQDLGELNKTTTLKQLSLTAGDADWYEFTLTDTGTAADFVQLLFKHSQGDLDVKLFKATDLNNFIVKSSGTVDNEKIIFNGLQPGQYYLQVYGYQSTSNPDYSIVLTNEDSKYNNYTGLTKDVYIKDNDLPTVKLIAGPTASELFSQPSYFAVALSNVAPGKTFGENGLAIKYRLVGGSASYGNDYQPIPGLNNNEGVVQIAPGNIQNNLIIVPIDDKLAEGLNIKVISRTVGATSNNKTLIALNIETTLQESTTIKAGTKLSFVKGIVGEVTSDTTLSQYNGNTYRGNVTVSVNATDVNDIQVNTPGKVALETITVELLPSDGYILNPDYKTATLGLADDDIPGVRVVEVGSTTVAGENRPAEYQVSLLSEPEAPVKIRITPGAEVEFVNPVNPTTVQVTKEVYTLDPFSSNIFALKLNGLVPTNKGDAVTVDVVLEKRPFENVTITLDDGLDSSTNPTDAVTVTFTPDDWDQPRQNIPLSYLDKNTVGLGNYQLSTQATFDPNQSINLDVTRDEGDKYTVADSSIFDVLLNTPNPTSNSSTSFSVKLKSQPQSNITVKLEDGFESSNNTSAQTLTFTTTNWNSYQSVTLANLDKELGESYRLKATVTGNTTNQSTVNLGITHTQTQVSKQTTELTFTPNEWYKLQTVTVKGSDDNFAEPNLYHVSNINYQVTSADIGYDNFFVPQQTIFIVDRILSPKETSSALKEGLELLQDSMDSLTVPILGDLGDVAPDLIDQFSDKLSNKIAQEENLTAVRLKGIVEDVLKTLGLKSFDVAVEINEDEVKVQLEMKKDYDLFSFSLDSDGGIPALGIDLKTEGVLSSTFEYIISLGFGLHKDFGFFIDTQTTGFKAEVKVGLSEDFEGEGNISFLRLNFENDPLNKSELSFKAEAKLKDLDTHAGLRYFDVNRNGVLDTTPFSYDLNDNGTIEPTEQNLKEKFTPIDAQGKYTELTPTAGDVFDVNSNGKYNYPLYQRQEGIYRTTSDGLTYYFDVNRNGKLDRGIVGKTDEPSTTNSAFFNKEFVVKKTTPTTTTGAGSIPQFYIDFNSNNAFDATEKINKSWDKNNNLKLDADVDEVGEGLLTNDVGMAFLDRNNNKLFDLGEPYISSEFSTLALDDRAKSDEGDFIDFDENEVLDTDKTWDLKILVGQNTDGKTAEYLDINRNGRIDKYEPQRINTLETLTIPDSDESLKGFGNGAGGTRIDLKDAIVSFNILTNGSIRYLDQNKNGTFQDNTDLPLNIEVDIPDEVAREADIEPSVNTTSSKKFYLSDVLRIASYDTTFTFLDVNGDGRFTIKPEGSAALTKPSIYGIEPQVLVADGFRFVDVDFNGELTRNEDNIPLEPLAEPNNTFDTGAVKPAGTTGTVVKLLDDGDRLTLTELKNFYSNPALKLTDLVKYEISGNANLGLKTNTSIGGNTAFPSISVDLGVNLPLFNYGNKEQAEKTNVDVQFNDVTLDFGSFLTDFVGPIMIQVNDILEPIKPIIQFLNADTKFLSYIGLESVFNADGKPGVSILDIAKTVAKLYPNSSGGSGGSGSSTPLVDKINKAIKFADTLTQITELVEAFNALPEGDTINIELGSYSLADLKGASKQQKDATAAIKVPATGNSTTTGTTTVKTNQPATSPTTQAANSSKANFLTKLQNLDGFSMPILTNPVTTLRLLLGEQDVDLIKYDIPDFEFSIEKTLGPWYPVPTFPAFKVELPLSFQAKTDFSVGYDTRGIEDWQEEDFAFSEIYKVLDGFYVDDLDGSGNEKPEAEIKAGIALEGSLDAAILSASLKGGLEGIITFDLLDEGELNGSSDGKIRGSEIISRISEPLELFQLDGLIEAYLKAKVSSLGSTLWSKELGRFEIAKFSLGANNSLSLFGRSVDGFIQGGTVFLDANFNAVVDVGEPTTITNRNGQFELVIPAATFTQLDANQDGVLDLTEGRLAMVGGIDSASELPFEGILTAPVGVATITPFTSLVERVVRRSSEPLTIEAGSNLITTKLSLSASFHVFPQIRVIAHVENIIGFPDGRIIFVPDQFDASELVYISDNLDEVVATNGWTGYHLQFEPYGLSVPPALAINPATGEYESLIYQPTIDEASQQYLLGAQIQLVSEQLAAFTGKPIDEILDQLADLAINSGEIILANFNYEQLIPDTFTYIQKLTASLAIKAASQSLTNQAYRQIDYDGDGNDDDGSGFVGTTYNIYEKIFRINGKMQVIGENLEDLLGQIARNELHITYSQLNQDFSPPVLSSQLNNATGIVINVFPPQTADFERTITEDTSYTFAVADFAFTKGDPDDTLKSVIIETLPSRGTLQLGTQVLTPGMEVFAADIDAGSFTYIPNPNGVGDDYNQFKFRVTDGKFFSDEPHTVNINVTPVNDAPFLSESITDQSFNEDSPLRFLLPTGIFADVDGNLLTQSVTLTDNSPLVPWLTFNPNTGEFSGTPPTNFNGTVDVKVTASDGSLSNFGNFTIFINPVNDAPTTNKPLEPQILTKDTAFNLTIPPDTFTDVDTGDTLSYDLSSLPDGLTLDSQTGIISGTPTVIGINSLTLRATDNQGLSAITSLELNVFNGVTGATSGDNTLGGTNTDDLIEAQDGRDIVTGGKGNDRIVGGSGSDVLAGGEGRDTFVYTSIRDSGDRLTDFNVNEDFLNFRALLNSLNYSGSNPVADGYISWRALNAGTLISVDSDGSAGRGVARPFITLETVTSSQLTLNNFIF